MPWFRCFVHGENFPGELCDVPGLAGFYINLFVEASDPEEAEQLALQALKADERFKQPPDYKARGIAKVYFEEIHEIDDEDVPKVQQGIVWYDMADE